MGMLLFAMPALITLLVTFSKRNLLISGEEKKQIGLGKYWQKKAFFQSAGDALAYIVLQAGKYSE